MSTYSICKVIFLLTLCHITNNIIKDDILHLDYIVLFYVHYTEVASLVPFHLLGLRLSISGLIWGVFFFALLILQPFFLFLDVLPHLCLPPGAVRHLFSLLESFGVFSTSWVLE